MSRALPPPARRLAYAVGASLMLLSSALLSACFQDGGPGESSETGVSSASAASTVSTSEGGSSSVAGSSDASAGGTSMSSDSGNTGTTEPVATSADTSAGTSTGTSTGATTGNDDKCVPPLIDCDNDGDCEDLDTDLDHCGACDSPCSEVCDNGECLSSRIVFITSVKAAGFPGAESIDGYCDGRAFIAGLPGEYVAWVSDAQSSAAERMTHSAVPWVMPDDVVVADNWDDLTDGTLQAPININEFGAEVTGECDELGTWSGTNPDGTHKPGQDCDGWSSINESDSATVIGSAGVMGSGWSDGGCPERQCNDNARVFCFQK